MSEITIFIKSSMKDDKTSFSIDASTTTVADLKQMISSHLDVPVDEQRLIFRGRILADGETLSSYEVTDGATVHMARSRKKIEEKDASSSSTPVSSAPSSGAAPPSSNPFASLLSGFGGNLSSPAQPNSANAGANPFASLLGNMGGMGGMGGLGGMGGMGGAGNPFAMLNDPNFMESMMQSPMFQGIMNNPEFLSSMIESNPALQRMFDQNPQLRHAMTDPSFLRQMSQVASNPELMREMMRNTDRAMANIESMPGGFDALRRAHNDLQEPLFEALMSSNGNSNSGSNAQVEAGAPERNDGSRPPNPWARPSAPSPNAAGPDGNANPFASMFDNDVINQMTSNMLSNPNMMQSIFGSNPALAQGMNANPLLGQMFTPENMQRMMQPENLRAMMQIQEGFAQLQRAGILPDTSAMLQGGGFNPFSLLQQTSTTNLSPPNTSTGSSTAPSEKASEKDETEKSSSPTNTTNNNSNPQSGNAANPFANILQSMMSGGQNPFMSMFGGGQPGADNAESPRTRHRIQLDQLHTMGFLDDEANLRALSLSGGDVTGALNYLLGGN